MTPELALPVSLAEGRLLEALPRATDVARLHGEHKLLLGPGVPEG